MTWCDNCLACEKRQGAAGIVWCEIAHGFVINDNSNCTLKVEEGEK
jgi:hypothetical protein